MNLGKLVPTRIPILYLILAVLIVVGVVPLYFYGTQVVGINRERLKTNERLLQNTVGRSLADDISNRRLNYPTALAILLPVIQLASGNDLAGSKEVPPG